MFEETIARVRATGELWFRAPMWIISALALALLHGLAPAETQWQLMAWYSIILILSTSLSNTPLTFFTGQGAGVVQTLEYLFRGTPLPDPEKPNADAEERRRSEVGFWTLMPSAFVTWVFAKSINNSALYGTRWGLMGGVVYAGWYLSFPSAAAFGYWIRTRKGYGSLPTAIDACYGSSATVLFGLIVLYRLWNEIWSNTVVVAAYYSVDEKTPEWWTACALSAVVPAIFVLMGGMRSSLITDVLMAGLGLLFLFVILGFIGREMPDGINSIWTYAPPSGWFTGSTTALGASILQGVASYPFHDAVLTDRCFLSRPQTMLASMLVGGAIAAMFIILYSAIGIYGTYALGKLSFYASAPVARSLGPTAFSFVNLIMMTSSMSTIDSAYGSVSKLIGLEFAGWFKLPGDMRERGRTGPLRPTDIDNVGPAHMLVARVSIALLALVGTLYVLVDTSTINATEVSGTMVMGLGPPIWMLCVWKHNSKPGADDGWQRAPLMFVLPYTVGIFFGVVYNTAVVGVGASKARAVAMMAPCAMGVGSFRVFLGWNVVGHCMCTAACLIGWAIHQTVWRLGTVDPPSSVEHPVSGERVVRAGFESVFDDARPKAAQPFKAVAAA